MMTCTLDEMLPPDHRARTVWAVVEKLDVSAFENHLRARGSEPGRAATDPRILIGLWLYATIDGVGTGREIDRLCGVHDAYRWIAGGVSLNYHTINDFRVSHEAALDDLFTQIVAALVKQGLVDVTRLSQDGTRVRASAGSNSFRSEATIERLRDDARAHLDHLKQQNDPAQSAQQRAKQQADAEDRLSRLDAAMAQIPAMQEAQRKRAKRSGREPGTTRVSVTEPDARMMKMSSGGFRPGHNVQLATDGKGRAIVGVDVVNAGSDAGLDAPMREQVERRTGQTIKEHLIDGGYASLDAIDEAATNDVTVYAPVNPPNRKGVDPHARKPRDTDHTAAWRARMATDEAKAIYKTRGSTIETINGDLKAHRGMRQFNVRGSPKVRTVALWYALAFNILRFGLELTATACEIC